MNVQYKLVHGAHRSVECSTSRVINEKVVAVMGMKAGTDKGADISAGDKRTVRDSLLASYHERDFLPHANGRDYGGRSERRLR